MPEPSEAYQYLMHLRRRWPVVAAAAVFAIALSVVLTLLQTKQYTARSSILIHPPGSSDPRAAMAISPVYLESLKTYEHFASSDSLFERAVKELQIRTPGEQRPLSSLKGQVLKVEIPRNTRILEISATLPDPQKARALAAYIANETVRLNQSANVESDEDHSAQIESLVAAAKERVEKAENESMRLAEEQPTDGLLEEVEALVETRAFLQRQLLVTEAASVEPPPDGVANRPSSGLGPDLAPRGELPGTGSFVKVRPEEARRQIAELDKQIAQTRKTLAIRTARHEAAEAERESAWAALSAAEERLADARAAVATRGERLQLIDPGVVPERPSSPNMPLNLLAAFLLALVLSILYLTLEFSLQLRKAENVRRSFRVAGHG